MCRRAERAYQRPVCMSSCTIGWIAVMLAVCGFSHAAYSRIMHSVWVISTAEQCQSRPERPVMFTWSVISTSLLCRMLAQNRRCLLTLEHDRDTSDGMMCLFWRRRRRRMDYPARSPAGTPGSVPIQGRAVLPSTYRTLPPRQNPMIAVNE
ncbi:hypothetical protein OBBRIDRAFT_170807 [Obba rivulosa]|uniref:Uncharacterized protein n=1 Tax=Obba rivulosa TaxID=1052685 RepID=A0A8E2DGM3_9APHY|nr:hypothetical protein OBBRIDRAFT_170807 [Obba rivulosa]